MLDSYFTYGGVQHRLRFTLADQFVDKRICPELQLERMDKLKVLCRLQPRSVYTQSLLVYTRMRCFERPYFIGCRQPLILAARLPFRQFDGEGTDKLYVLPDMLSEFIRSYILRHEEYPQRGAFRGEHSNLFREATRTLMAHDLLCFTAYDVPIPHKKKR